LDLTDFGLTDVDQLNLVEHDGNVFAYLDEDTSIQLTDVKHIEDLGDDFLVTTPTIPAPAPVPTPVPTPTPMPEPAAELHFINGGEGDDFLLGTDVDDSIFGGQGNDLLIGGKGADIFVFDADSGYNRIEDFNSTEGDQIDLSGTGIKDLNDINLVENDGTVFIYIDEDTSVELTGIGSVDDIDLEADFIL